MRFSSIFQRPAPPDASGAAAEDEALVPPVDAVAVPAVAPELPEDLDARVRLLGEWQWLLD